LSNLEIIQALYEAFAGGRLERVLDLVDPTCVIRQDEALPWGGRFDGFDGVATFAARLGENIHSTLVTRELYEAGDRVVQCGRSQGTVLASGVTFDVPEVHVWTLHDKKVVTAEFYVESLRVLAALGTPS
jgi:ketosteroid isomerase-like protein